jgi:hypothetical protein
VKVTRILFAISDVFAAIACALCGLVIPFYAFFGLTYFRMAHLDPSAAVIALSAIMCFLAATGFWLLLRRKALGLALALLVAVPQVSQGRIFSAFLVAAVVLLLCGLPLLLAFMESRKSRRESAQGVA